MQESHAVCKTKTAVQKWNTTFCRKVASCADNPLSVCVCDVRMNELVSGGRDDRNDRRDSMNEMIEEIV